MVSSILGPFVDYEQVIGDPELKPGALVEISRKVYNHWAIVHKVCRKTGVVQCYHVDKSGDYTRKGVIRTGRARTGRQNLCRVNNKVEEARRRGRKERDLDEVFCELDALKNTKVDYQFNLNNCEWYCTRWKYGMGWSSQVFHAELMTLPVAYFAGAATVMVAGGPVAFAIGLISCYGVPVYLGAKYLKIKQLYHRTKQNC